MKSLVASIVAFVFCVLVLIQAGLAQGEGYVCDGPFNGCTASQCNPGPGTCPVSELSYLYFDVIPSSISTCVPAPNTCYPTEERTACSEKTWASKGMYGCTNYVCMFPTFEVYVCPL